MYCSNCGKEIRDGEAFCPQCGTKVGETRKGIQIDFDLKKYLPKKQGILDKLGTAKIMYFASILLQIIAFFIIGDSMLKISYTVLFKGSVEIGMFVDREKLEILFRVGYILAVAVMLVPLVRDKEWEGKYFILSFCMPVIAIIWLSITFSSGSSKISSNDIMKAADVTVELTKSGWAFLLVSVGSIFLTAKTCSELIHR